MSNSSNLNLKEIYPYLLDASLREPEVLKRLRDETAAMPEACMQIAPEQGQFLTLLMKMIGAKKAIEIGTYTGYSSMCIAEGLGPDGQLICCDINKQSTDVAQKYWQAAALQERIRLQLAPALETLDTLIDNGGREQFDFAFIDADKTNYMAYYSRCLVLLRPGGVIAVDNVLWGGSVADPSIQDDNTVAIRRFNQQIKNDERVDISMLPMADGLSLLRKK